ncbi:hypothetical protein C8Q75DRAFT_455696 [Abortiporus biennis]|nr:hypothetical protein C8Q75DRAFT_455696 [Abortiporus biennis]
MSLLTCGPEYKPPANGVCFSEEEETEWVRTHQPFRYLPRMYQVYGRLRPLPIFHWAITFTTQEAYDICVKKRLPPFCSDEFPEEDKSEAVDRLVEYFEDIYPSVRHTIERTLTLTTGSGVHFLSLYTNRSRYMYTEQERDRIHEGIRQVMREIKALLSAKTRKRWLWYWNSMEGPVTGWSPTTHPEFASYLAQNYDYKDDEDRDEDYDEYKEYTEYEDNEDNGRDNGKDNGEDDDEDDDSDDDNGDDNGDGDEDNEDASDSSGELTEVENGKRMK